MPSAAARRLYEDQIPSFMSVFDLGAAAAMDEQGAVAVVDPKILGFPLPTGYDAKLPAPAASAASAPSAPLTASTALAASAAPAASAASSLPCDPSHRHHDSTSTQASESEDSSPTTTMSCTDSSSLSDPSPSSSPDSPINLVPLATFSGPSFAGGFSSMSVGLASLSVMDPGGHASSHASGHQERPMTSPSPRRARNMKGLSIQPPFISSALSSNLASEPSSPSFIKPQIPSMKRKPSQLSLKTSTHELLSKATAIEVPQSPSLVMPPILQRRALKHSTSSPHMLSSLKSATFGPAGGMTFPTVLERNESGLSSFLRPTRPAGPVGFDAAILEEESPIRTQIASRAAFEFEPYHEHENNEDQKTPGYPDGPIAIYGDNVYLYLEPTAEEASRFDVVINVAREVSNPFKTAAAASPPASRPPPAPRCPHDTKQPAAPRKLEPISEPDVEPAGEAGAEKGPEPLDPAPMVLEPVESSPMEAIDGSSSVPTATTIATTTTTATTAASKLKQRAPALTLTLAEPASTEGTEALSHEDSTPTTPKATLPLKEPEYIHIPWDHNTDIGEDLMMLCETIERKTKEGKKVLIHCQQGASRSASLIIAYGIYQNPELSVNDAYYAAQAKSKWISPNMRLMYCLQDFQKEVGKRWLPSSSALRPRSGRSPTKHRAALSADAIDIAPKEPLSAPLPAEDGNGASPGALARSAERSPMRPRGNSTPSSRDAISPGPSSAPSSFSWDPKEDERDRQRFGRFHFDRPSPLPQQPPERKPPAPALEPSALKPPVLKPPALKPPALKPPELTLPFSFARSLDSHDRPGSNGSGDGGGTFVRPPPSPGFAAHRFGGFPGSLRISNNASSSSSGLAGLPPPPFSPGFPPSRRFGSDGLDSILARDMAGSSAAATEGRRPPPALQTAADDSKLPAACEQIATTTTTIAVRAAFPVEEPLMSPRAETMTNNPLHDQLAAECSGMRFVEVPPTPSEGLFSPRETMFPRDPFFPLGRPTQVADPRSPPTKGEAPIVRSIDDLI